MTKPKHKYTVKRVALDGIGWEYNANKNVWELWFGDKAHLCISTSTKSVIRYFIDSIYSQLYSR